MIKFGGLVLQETPHNFQIFRALPYFRVSGEIRVSAHSDMSTEQCVIVRSSFEHKVWNFVSQSLRRFKQSRKKSGKNTIISQVFHPRQRCLIVEVLQCFDIGHISFEVDERFVARWKFVFGDQPLSFEPGPWPFGYGPHLIDADLVRVFSASGDGSKCYYTLFLIKRTFFVNTILHDKI